MGLERVKDLFPLCVPCGDCFQHGPANPFKEDNLPPPYTRCPTYEWYRFLSYTLRGRCAMADAVHNLGFEITPEVIESVYMCLGCGQCGEDCWLKEDALSITRAFREEIVERGLGPPEADKAFDINIIRAHNPLGEKPERRAEWAQELRLPNSGPDIFFAGCMDPYWYPENAKATVRVLEAIGIDVGYLGSDEWCCGAHSGWDGQTTIEEDMAWHNLQMIKAAGAKRVIFNCPGCYQTFKKDYPKIVGALPFEVIHFTELLADHIEAAKIAFKMCNERITYHDPCHLGRHLKIYEPPRKVLTSIPGIELQEMNRHGRWAWCCGGSRGTIILLDPAFSRWTTKQRLMEAKDTAETLVTACPLCFHTFSTTAEEERIDISVYDFPTFMANAMDI